MVPYSMVRETFRILCSGRSIVSYILNMTCVLISIQGFMV